MSMDWMQFVFAFLIGGAFGVIGQLLVDRTRLTPARILVGYVFLGAIGVYPYLVKLAGAGASVPLTGFGNLLAKGVREAVDKRGFVGIFTGGLTAASGGIGAAIVFGWLAGVIFKQKDK